MEIFDKAKPEIYNPVENRYKEMSYNRCGNSGILLPKLSLGLWHNFGLHDNFVKAQNILRSAFDAGITHFDLANNYGPPYGSAEETFGRIFRNDFSKYRDELLISTKAGFDMWQGPYGNWGSKKHLSSSLDQSLTRMGLNYVDIFYHHRPDPETPLEETMGALDQIVKSGKALYVGLSNYDVKETEKAILILKDLGTPCLIHQSKYSMLERNVEQVLLPALSNNKVGSIVFSPLAQGLLSNKYLDGIPVDSRAGRANTYLEIKDVEKTLTKIKGLNSIAQDRGQNLAQMAIAWILNNPLVTSVLVGVSSSKQLDDNIKSLKNTDFSEDELKKINEVLN